MFKNGRINYTLMTPGTNSDTSQYFSNSLKPSIDISTIRTYKQQKFNNQPSLEKHVRVNVLLRVFCLLFWALILVACAYVAYAHVQFFQHILLHSMLHIDSVLSNSTVSEKQVVKTNPPPAPPYLYSSTKGSSPEHSSGFSLNDIYEE